jgi:integrase
MVELIALYWRHAQTYYVKGGRPTSEQATIRQALRPVKKLYGHTRAEDFGPLALRAVRDAMLVQPITRKFKELDLATGKKKIVERVVGNGWCRGYINKQVNRIRRMFLWAVAHELVPETVHRALTAVEDLQKGRTTAREKPRIRPVDDATVEATLSLLPPMVATIARVQRLSGMRPQEAVAIRGDEIDRSDPTCWVYRPSRFKSEHHDRERVIFFGPRAQELLSPYLAEAGAGYLFSPIRSEHARNEERKRHRKSPMTPSQAKRKPRGRTRAPLRECYDTASYRRAIRRACLKLEIPIWHPNQIRHTAGTDVRRQFGLEASQAVLGHAELSVTQIYSEVDLERAKEVMRQVG